MSNIPLDHECFKYIFRSGSTGEFYFDVVDDAFGYWYSYNDLPRTEWQKWDISAHDFNTRYPDFIKDRVRIVLCGPVQPPPSPIIQKIREMEKRRQVAYA